MNPARCELCAREGLGDTRSQNNRADDLGQLWLLLFYATKLILGIKIELHSQAEPIARPLRDEDIPALEKALREGWDPNEPILATTYSLKNPPILIAIEHRKEKTLDFLLAHGVEFNLLRGKPVLQPIYIGWPLSTLDKLIAHGARIYIRDGNANAYSRAISNKRFDLLPELLRRGLPVPWTADTPCDTQSSIGTGMQFGFSSGAWTPTGHLLDTHPVSLDIQGAV